MQDSVESKLSLQIFFFFFFFGDRIQKIGCYNQIDFYSNFVSCGKRKNEINACGSLWQKKIYTIWQFRRNSIDLFLGPSFFFLFFFSFMIESKRTIAMTRLSFMVISCRVGSAKTTLMCVGHYGKKTLYTFWLIRRNSIDLFLGPSCLFFFFQNPKDRLL